MIPWCPHSVLSGMLGGPSPCAWAVVPSVSWGTCWDRGDMLPTESGPQPSPVKATRDSGDLLLLSP